jgi:hypothetical protein
MLLCYTIFLFTSFVVHCGWLYTLVPVKIIMTGCGGEKRKTKKWRKASQTERVSCVQKCGKKDFGEVTSCKGRK